MIAFHVTCVPPTATHQAKRIVRVGRFSRLADKPELVAAKAMLDGLLLPHQPASPLTGAVRLTLDATWPWRASEPKRTRALGAVPHTSRPDADNIAKGITDRLVALRFLGDDNQVAELVVRKWWGDHPGIAVRIEPLADARLTTADPTRPAERMAQRMTADDHTAGYRCAECAAIHAARRRDAGWGRV